MADTSFMYIMFVCNLLLHSLSSEALCSIFWGRLQYGYEITHFNLIFCLQYICVEQNITFWLLSLFKIKKREQIQSYKSMLFCSQKWPNCAKDNFFQKNQWYNFHVPLDPFCYAKSQKKLLEVIQSYDDTSFLAPKWPICPEEIFSQKNHWYNFHVPLGPFNCPKF